MPKRDLYKVLGVPSGAPPSEIKRAYRRIAFAAHPDVGEHPDADRFRQAHEAYEVLSDPERRRSYEAEFEKQRRAWPERSGRTRPAWTVGDFPASSPFLEADYDTAWTFFSQRISRSRWLRRVTAEAVLTPWEAEFGCRVPFSVPCLVRCERCGGDGEWWMGGVCHECNGSGIAETSRELLLQLPAGSVDGERYEVDLSEAGISNLVLEVRISVEL